MVVIPAVPSDLVDVGRQICVHCAETALSSEAYK